MIRDRVKPAAFGALAATLGLLVIAVLALELAPRYLVRGDNGLDAVQHLKAENDARAPVVAFLIAAGAAGTLWFTAQTYRLTRRGQVTGRYTAAVGQLGDTMSSVRIGAVAALARIADDDQAERSTIILVLGAFIRERSNERRPDVNATPADVSAALKSIAKVLRDPDVVDLRGADLAEADLIELPPHRRTGPEAFRPDLTSGR